MDFSGSRRTRGWICLALALATFGVYWQVYRFGFVNFDDPDYVSNNPMVSHGLSLKGILWAFTSFHASNWHPLTWISHMIDCQIFGMNPGGPHIVNVLLHAANAILLFLLLQRLTGALWRSATVAGLFALHPLHVESVAWISERKDVLSTFFGLLSLLAYAGYVDAAKAQSPNAKSRFIRALVLFALSLMSKPMLVTLPFVLLLLDFWPLQRLENSGWRAFGSRQFAKLAKEKWPWFALVAASCAVTLFAQVSAMTPSAHLAFSSRVINALESYFWYTEKIFWPAKLAAFYPFELVRPIGPLVLAILWLILTSCVCVASLKRSPFLFVGWFWFVGTLIPVIGLVHVGSQGMADRYAYVPSIGIFIAVVWLAHQMLSGSKQAIAAGGFVGGCVLVVLAMTASLQVRYWQSTLTLFSHAVTVTPNNDTALNNLGVAYYELNRDEDAMKKYQLALQISPNAPDIHKNIGLVLARNGKPDEALVQYQEAARLAPKNASYQNFLAEALVVRGSNEMALPYFREAVRLDPKNAQYQNDLAVSLVTAGNRTDAMPHYLRAVQLEPSNARYQNNFATALIRAGDPAAAEQHYRAAIQADPKFADAYSNLGALLFVRRDYGGAAMQYSQAITLNPTNAGIRFNAGLAFLKVDRANEAVAQFGEAARLRPDWAEPLNLQAWTLATSSDDKVRNGAEAVKTAEKAAALTSPKQPAVLNTLAAAYAEAGRFDDAVATANQAIEIARRSGQTNLVSRIERTLPLYQSHTPLRENNSGD